MISLENIFKSFEKKPVFENFSLKLEPGLIYCLMGPSGCGKTTLLRMLSGLDFPDKGKIQGFDYKKPSFVFQEDRLIESFTVLKNVALVLKKNNGAGVKWLEIMGLEGELCALPSELSGGMRRRVSLARAMAHGGDAFFMDEPFTGIDAPTKARLIPEVRGALRGKTTFVATHDMADAGLLADGIIMLGEPPQKTAALELLK